MLFGHNTNVTVDGTVFHVQTEDRGTATAMIDTTVHCRGRVLHRRTSKYLDLVPLDADREQSLKVRLDDQHFAVIEELRTGVLVVAAPPTIAKDSARSQPLSPLPVAAQPKIIAVEMLNPRTWLSGKHATLYLMARHKDGGDPAIGARITARIAGAIEPTAVTTVAGADGHAQLEFDMPQLSGDDAALVIEADAGEARGQLRFQLRAKPKAPAAG